MFQLMSDSIDVFLNLIFCLLCNDQRLLSRNVLDRRNEHSASYVSCLLFLVRLDANVRKRLSNLLLFLSRLRFYASLFRLYCVMFRCRRRFQRSYHRNQILTHELIRLKESYVYGRYVHKRCLLHQFPFLTKRHG